VRNWHVSDKPSLSDHRYILFQIGNVEITLVDFRAPRELIENPMRKTPIVYLEAAQSYVRSVQDVELAVDWLQQSILSSFLL
jgi:hypothetical protein